MNEIKHTPGPWLLEKDKYTRCAFDIYSETSSRKLQKWRKDNPEKKQTSFSGVSVARCHKTWNGSGADCGPTDGLIDDEEVLANSTLIAAAPDMLEALEKIERGLPSREGLGGHASLVGLGNTARAAIAKAKGTK